MKPSIDIPTIFHFQSDKQRMRDYIAIKAPIDGCDYTNSYTIPGEIWFYWVGVQGSPGSPWTPHPVEPCLDPPPGRTLYLSYFLQENRAKLEYM